MLVLILDYYQEKLMTLFKKNPYFMTVLGPVCPNVDKQEFSWKKVLCKFLDIPIIYHYAKNQKKPFRHLRKTLKPRTDGRTDGRTDRQTDRQR